MRIYLTYSKKFGDSTKPVLERYVFGKDCKLSICEFYAYFLHEVSSRLLSLFTGRKLLPYREYKVTITFKAS